jgi:hypothetical protein
MRSLVVLLVLLSVAFAFRMDSEEAVGDVNWPFTNCNADSVKITALALTTQPAKSKNSTAKIVHSCYIVDWLCVIQGTAKGSGCRSDLQRRPRKC